MTHQIRRMRAAAVAGSVLLMMAASAHAAGDQISTNESQAGEPSAGAMAFDLVVIRPLSLAATVLGVGLFVLDLPLAPFQKNAPEQPFHQFVVNPARYTFTRPLGAIDR